RRRAKRRAAELESRVLRARVDAGLTVDSGECGSHTRLRLWLIALPAARAERVRCFRARCLSRELLSMSRSLQLGSVRRWALLWALTPALSIACYDRGDRWLPQEEPPPVCELGSTRCNGALERCEAGTDGPEWAVFDDCPKQDLVCAPALQR